MSKIKRALISVSDKAGVVELARTLADMGVEILSTGGTARSVREAGVTVKDVSAYTGFPEMMGGRVKTLHPKVHGGLLGRRDNENDRKDMEEHGIEPIDMVAVNLYPFEATISKEGVTFDECIENIDIGGPTMLRSAAKNFRDVVVVVDPRDYEHILEEMRNLGGDVSYKTRSRLARKVFMHTSRYDTLIADYLTAVVEDARPFPPAMTLTYRKAGSLRYGENPHQPAAAYAERAQGLSLFEATVLQGKEMSFNNYMDAHAGVMLAREFPGTACAIIKHNNPCGVALGEGSADAYVKAYKTDPVSAFGGVLCFTVPVDGDCAREITKIFAEVIVAPGYTEEARSVLAEKKNMRLLELPDFRAPLAGKDLKRIAGGVLAQEWDTEEEPDIRTLEAVTRRAPAEEELAALDFAWRVCKHVKSNAIVYALKDRTVGIGVGQTSRVAAAKVGAIHALEPLRGSVVASDGFFPFSDGIEGIHKVGATAVIQPGGSIKDREVIEACDGFDMAMLMTGRRHFRH